MINDRLSQGFADWMANHRAPLFSESLDRYEQMQTCWEAPNAVFFRGRIKGLKQQVLGKLPKPSRAEEGLLSWVQRDYSISSALRTTFAAKVFALEASNLGPMIVYVDEDALPLSLSVGRSLLLTDLLAIASAIATGLGELHQEGVVHGNLSIDNIWLRARDGAIRISDFSLARHPSIHFPTSSPSFERDQRFLAPEQTGGPLQSADQCTDIYAFGIILFVLIAGRLPFSSDDATSIPDSRAGIHPGFSAELRARVPTPLAQLVLKCLETNSQDRYRSASGLRADLLECISQLQSKGTIDEFTLGTHDPTSIFRIPSGLYGREAETGVLRRFVRSRQPRPTVMLVTGIPGVGKTSFLNQLSDFALKENAHFIRGKFDQYRRNVPYSSLAQAFRDLIHQLLTEPQTQLLTIRKRLLAASEGNARLLLDVIPDLELIIGPQPTVASLPPLEARNRFNRLFKNVIQVLASGNQPLCLFMDDLQWADSASLEFLASVLSELETRCIIFVAAYRESDVGKSHPLEEMITALETAGIVCQRLNLSPIGLSDCARLIRDTVGGPADKCLPLAELLHSRTHGNPLYLTQLLLFLHETKLISFDYCAGAWQWDLQRIRAQAVTDDVLALLHMRLEGLPPNTRYILSVAACLGTTFDVGKLECAAGRSDLVRDLMACVRTDLIIEVADLDADLSEDHGHEAKRFRFVHDRIQQAAFDLVEDDAKKSFRLHIGRRVLSRLTQEQKAVPQIDVLDNFNYAWQTIGGREERLEIARLNLIAGSSARETLAYKDALRYLLIGIKLLDSAAWTDTDDLAFELHANALECEYLSGAFARADQLFQLLLDKATSKVAKAKVYLTKILLDTSEERYDHAIEIGIEALRLFGIRFRRDPGMIDLIRELVVARVRMRGRRARDLLSEPPLTDHEKIAALKILVALFPTAYFLSPNLLMFSGLKVVNYSLRYGISYLSASGFVLYGLVTGAVMRDVRRGYELGQFAVELAELGKDPGVMCKVLVIFGLFIKYWRDRIDESLPLIERARELALRVGDHQYVNYAIIGRLSLDFSRGVDLSALRSYCDSYERFVRQSKDAFPIESILMWKGSILALTDETNPAHSLSNTSYDQSIAENRYRQTHNLTLLCYQYTLRSQLCYLFGRYEEALKVSDDGDKVVKSAPGQITVADHYLYRGLTAVAMLGSGAPDQARLRDIVSRCVRELNFFAKNSPVNFLPYARLLEAELARARGEIASALKLYNLVIDLAERENFHQLIGLANERAARCFLAQGQRRTAASYLTWARSAYLRWGALAKVKALDHEFEALFEFLPGRQETQPDPKRPPVPDEEESFDVAAATRAIQAAALEKGLDRILPHLMQRIREQTGAESAHLIIPIGGTYRVQATAQAADAIPPLDGERASRFSPSIVNYVVHTGSDLIIDNAHLDQRFARCDYLTCHRPNSVMCAAIVKQSELLGVIYLEHSRLKGVFNPDKLQWLRVLAGEVGLATRADKLSRYREYVHRFAPILAAKEIDADPDAPDLAVREKEVSILFADLAGYTKMYELMGRHETDDFVNRAFSDFVEEIHRCHGVVLDVRGDELLVLFQEQDYGGHAVNAAAAALSISQAAVEFNSNRSHDELSIVVNMAINSGFAAIGLQPIDSAAGARWRYDVTGMTVNVAARVRDLARGGDILISAATADMLSEKFRYEDMGTHSVKNVSSPVRIFRLVSESSEATR